MDYVNIPNTKYEINKEGSVRRKYKNGKVKYLKPYKDKGNPYYRVSIHKNKITIHRLLGICFIPNPNMYKCIDHIDRNKHNNNVNNLRWATHSMNTKNSLRIIDKKGSIAKRKNKFQASFYHEQKKLYKTYSTREECEEWLKKVKKNNDMYIEYKNVCNESQNYMKNNLTNISKL